MLRGIFLHPLLEFFAHRSMGFQKRRQVSTQTGQQSGVDLLVNEKEWLAPARAFRLHGIDPVAGGPAQTESFAGHVMAGQRGQITGIHAHVAVNLKHQIAFDLRHHPLFGQQSVPLNGLPCLTAQDLQLLPQGAHLRDAIQAQQMPPFAGRHIAQLASP
jgi:hypothetical protein